LLDKKIVKRSTEAALVLGNNLSIGEELVEYLTYILEIPEEKIPGVIGIYNDYSKETTME
jgi:hypothetical protein